MPRTFRVGLLCQVGLLCAACGGQDALSSDETGSASASAVASPGYGSVAFEELTPTPAGGTIADAISRLSWLQGRGVAVTLHWKAENINDPERWRFVAEAKRLGIRVHPWLTLPEGRPEDEDPRSPNHALTGYFPNATNYAAWIGHAKSLMAEWRRRGYAPTTMVVDLEMRKRDLHRFAELTNAGDMLGVIALLNSNINRTQYAAALKAYKTYVDEAHDLGWTVEASTLLPMLDDYADSDDGLRQAFNIPLDNNPQAASAIKWDTVTFQVMRTLYQESYPGLTPYFVRYYSGEARMRFGALAGVALGLTHRGISPTAPVYATGTDLRLDVEAARQAGIPTSKIGVYSFLGFWQHQPPRPPEDWMQTPQTRPSWWPLPDTDTWLVQFVQTGLDDFF